MVVVAGTLAVLLHMERNEVLSRIGRTQPGKVDLSPRFFVQILLYAVLPLGAVVTSAFPELGNLLFAWMDPLLRTFH